ncbi:MAG: hypothetical protein Q8L56_06980 [Rhodocyclaceae bacterium]|nr:hypothetical protein [Rhodocyclaceae bacterium]
MEIVMSIDAETAQRVLAAWSALRSGDLKVAPKFEALAAELIAAPLTISGLVDTRSLSEEVIGFARIAGAGFRYFNTTEHPELPQAISMPDAQSELFRLFEQLFRGLTGTSFEKVSSLEDIKRLMLNRMKDSHEDMARRTNDALDELAQFYSIYAIAFFKYAKTLGGVRLVVGGQRSFGPSALSAVRITGLYADTQLIPDPIHPFLASDLPLNAKHLQLARGLFTILQIRPLVDLQLPVPPVFIFPSFEQGLEVNDAHTKLGIESLVLSVVSPLCNGSISTLDELFEYAKKYEDEFVQAILSNRLFVPPGLEPIQAMDRDQAIRAYFDGICGIRSADAVSQMERLPPGILMLNGVMERLVPQYHLLENANELGAQPLLSQAVHWHYFEKCAQATAQELHRKTVLSDQAFQTLLALQDDSLSWLANIPVHQLAELIGNNEHRWFREELNKYTSLLANTNVADPSEMVREVNHGLTSLVQGQRKAMGEIERKYAPNKAGVFVGGAAGLAVAGTVWMLPSLTPYLGVAVPEVAALATVGGGALGYINAKAGEWVEKRQAKRSLLGILASIRPR